MIKVTACQIRVIEKLKNNKCDLISFGKDRSIKYTCSCGNNTQSCIPNILKPKWSGCTKCSNKNRGNIRNYEYARKIFEEGGEILPLQEYKGNKTKLHYLCSFCNNEAFVSLSEFNRGRRCSSCSKERAKFTNMKKYGVENPFQSEICKQKTKNTNMKKYGYEHHMQNATISERSLKKTMAGKTYTFPSGKTVHCQGYEPRCFDILLNTYEEEDILTKRSDMPRIWYESKTRAGKKSIYYPDMFIPKDNIVIEVKSVYTLNMNKEKDNNIEKFISTATQGYELHLYVFDKKNFLYRKVYMPNHTIIMYPYPPANIVFI